MFELVAVDGKPVDLIGEEERKTDIAVGFERMAGEMAAIRKGIAQLTGAILAQQEEIARLNRALGTVRISRSQEIALQEAIRARAKAICQDEDMEGAERRMAGAIRATLRETTGARAIGDIQAAQFDKAMEIAGGWYMMGAVRRIRREAAGHGHE